MGLIKGLLVVFKHLFMRPVTQEYPEKKRVLPDAFRGKPTVEGCCACKICERVCPSGAIKIQKDEEKILFDIDLKKCIFCGNCTYYCPKGAIKMSKEYELATDNKNDLILHYKCNCGGTNDN